MQKEKVTVSDIEQIHSVTTPIWHPNGVRVAYVKTSIDSKKNTYESSIYVVDEETKKENKWTTRKERISSIKWSPEGSYLSFLSTRDEGNQLYILPVNGGEAKQVMELPYGVSSYVWHPTEEKIWFTASYHNETGWEKQEDKKEEFPKPYKAGKMKYIQDGSGLVKQDRFSQIGVVEVETGSYERWSSDNDHQQVHAVSPNGKQIVTSTSPLENDDVFESDLTVVDIESKSSKTLSLQPGYYGGAAFCPSGDHLAFVGATRTFENATHSQLYVYNFKTEQAQSLTEGLDAPVGDYVVADIQQGASAPAVVWTEHDHLYFQVSTYGDVRVYFASLEGELYPVTQEGEHVYGYDVTPDGSKLAITVSDPTFPGELFVQSVTTGERTLLSHHNEEYVASRNLIAPEAIVFKGPKGWDVHGWIIKPVEAAEGKVPLVTNIHGGPHAFYANTFFHEMQLLAAQGVGVLYVNPRGSHSYSQEFVDAVRGDYGGNDYLDIMAAVDYAVKQYDWIDADRLGVTGGSYGGFMTNWIVGHTDRFKAAVTQRSISNWISFYGVSDIGYYFTEWQIQSDMNDIDKLWDHSPLKYAAQVKTPLLILHGEDDLRCPIEQAQQLYITLKRMGKEVEFVRFPQADHNLSRTGLPNLRKERLEQIIGWFNEYL